MRSIRVAILSPVFFCSALPQFASGQRPVAAESRKMDIAAPASSSSSPKDNGPTLDRRYAVAQGNWSATTISLFNTWSGLDSNSGRHMSFHSPNHRNMVEVDGEKAYMYVGLRRFDTEIDNVVQHDAELGWSPDSTKFFVTWSESGELGPWHMQVFGVDESGVHEFRGAELPARKDFERRVRRWPIDPQFNTPEGRAYWGGEEYCEPYHVIGGRWLNNSREILLSVLIRNTGDCRYMSEFNVYRVEATTGKVLHRYTAAEGHRLFGDKYLPIITR